MNNYIYSNNFFKNVDICALQSAEHFYDTFLNHFNINSILDVGCGRGAWLSVAKRKDVTTVFGIDGDYVDMNTLLISQNEFEKKNIELPFDLNKKFDLVQCLEVGEHINKDKSEILVKNIIKHGDFILFSAAQPGQGGTNHINEQEIKFWKNIYNDNGYLAFDFPRILNRDINNIMPWYRYNMILYVKKEAINLIPDNLLLYQCDNDYNFYKLIPLSWKLRLFILRVFPVKFLTLLSKIKYILNN